MKKSARTLLLASALVAVAQQLVDGQRLADHDVRLEIDA